jgi:WD40 repeat protein
LRFS